MSETRSEEKKALWAEIRKEIGNTYSIRIYANSDLQDTYSVNRVNIGIVHYDGDGNWSKLNCYLRETTMEVQTEFPLSKQ